MFRRHTLTSGLLFLIILTFCFSAVSELYSVDDLFVFEYDSQQYVLDHTAYAEESSDDYHWLFLMYNDNIIIDVNTERFPAYQGFSLTDAPESEIEAYIFDLLDLLSDSDIRFLNSVQTEVYPFLLFRLKDGSGSLLLAETVFDGLVLDFSAYYADGRSPDEALIDTLTSLLQGIHAWPVEQH